MSIRLRSTLAAAAAILIAVSVLGSAVDVLVARHLHRTQDRSLRSRAVEVAQLAAATPALLTAPGALDSPVGATQSIVEVLDRRGRIVARSLSLGGRVLPATLATAALRSGAGRFRTVEFDDQDVRAYVAPLADVSGSAAGGAVIVGASTADVEDTIRTLRALDAAVGARCSRDRRACGRAADARRPAAACAARAGGRARSSARAIRGSACLNRAAPTRSGGSRRRSTRCSAASSGPATPSAVFSQTRRTSCARR